MSNYKVEISRGKQGDMDRHFATGTAEPGVTAPKANPSIQRQAQAAVIAGADDATFEANNAYKHLSDVNGYDDWDEAILEITTDDGSIHPEGTVTDGDQVVIGGGGGAVTVDLTSGTGKPVTFVVVKNTHAANAMDVSINGNVIFEGVAAGDFQEIRGGGMSSITITSDGAQAATADILFAGYVIDTPRP